MFLLSCFSITFFSCQRKKDVGLNINNVECIDSIGYGNHYNPDSIVIREKDKIEKITTLLNNHTFRDLCKFPGKQTFRFYMKGSEYYRIQINKDRIKSPNGEYLCDEDIEAFMDNLLENGH